MKKGYIKCSNILITEWWGKVYVFLKDFRPTHIEFHYWENDIWYFYGVSDLFDELKEGDAVPQYDVTFIDMPDKTLTYSIQRIR